MNRSDLPLGEGWSLLPALGLSALAFALAGLTGLRFSPPPSAPPSLDRSAPPLAARAAITPVKTATVSVPAKDCPPTLAFHFAAGASTPLSSPDAEAQALIAWLIRHPEAQVVVNGHADANGSVARNLALSHARATNAARLLIERGLPKDRITARGFGAYQPLLGEDQLAEQNRRVEVLVQGQPNCPRGDLP